MGGGAGISPADVRHLVGPQAVELQPGDQAEGAAADADGAAQAAFLDGVCGRDGLFCAGRVCAAADPGVGVDGVRGVRDGLRLATTACLPDFW